MTHTCLFLKLCFFVIYNCFNYFCVFVTFPSVTLYNMCESINNTGSHYFRQYYYYH